MNALVVIKRKSCHHLVKQTFIVQINPVENITKETTTASLYILFSSASDHSARIVIFWENKHFLNEILINDAPLLVHFEVNSKL
jgi:hypothetical protein